MLFYGSTVPVLCYHKISECGGLTPEKFEDHLDYLKDNGYETVGSEDLYQFMTEGKKLPPKPVMLTFDDCHLDNWVYAIPLLNKKGFKGVFFAITSFIHSMEARPQLGEVNIPAILPAAESFVNAIKGNPKQFMSDKEIYKAVHTFGHEIYSHTETHKMCFRNLKQIGSFPDNSHWGVYGIYDNKPVDGSPTFEQGSAYVYNGFWPKVENGSINYKYRTDQERYDFCIKEFLYSKSYLEELLNKEVDFFCWPWGHFDTLSMDALKKTGYKASFTLERAPNVEGGDPFRINRLGVSDKKDVDWLDKRLRVYSKKVLSKFFIKKYNKNREIKNIMFITGYDCHSHFTSSINGMTEMDIMLHIFAGKNANLADEIKTKHQVTAIDLREDTVGKDISKEADELKIDIIHSFSSTTHEIAAEIKGKMLRAPKLVIHKDLDTKLSTKVKKAADGYTCDKTSDIKALIDKGVEKSKVHYIEGHPGIDLISFYSEIIDN